MTLISAEKRDKLLTQALKELEYSQRYKEVRENSWRLNDMLLNPDKSLTTIKDKDGLVNTKTARDNRADVPLYEIQSFRHTFLSKLGSPMTFKYVRGELGDERKANLMNGIKEKDYKLGRWDFKDLMGRQDAATYGRAVFFYQASSDNGYTSILKNIDPYDFHIDPNVGGICSADGYSGDPIDTARYAGWWNVKLTKRQLKDGVKSKLYYKDTVESLVNGNPSTSAKEEADKTHRNSASRDELVDPNVFTFYAWFTRDEDDELVYMLFDSNKVCVRAEMWKNLSTSGRIPVWTWAAFPDPREFWSPSPIDYYRGIAIAKQKSINQMLDNAEQVNNPQKVINVDHIRNLSQVRYQRNGIIEIEGNTTVQNAMQTVQTASIDTPLAVYDKLDAIGQKTTGITAAMVGTSQEEVVSIYEGNKQEAESRLSLMARSYTEGHYRFAQLYKEGVQTHLRKKIAVEIMGPQGLDIEYVKYTDVKAGKNDYDILIEATDAEKRTDSVERKNKAVFLTAQRQNEIVNKSVIFEEEAKVVGYDDVFIRRALDTRSYEDMNVLSAADEAFQLVLDGKTPPEYKLINTDFVQRLNDLWRTHSHEMTTEQSAAMEQYINLSLDEASTQAARDIMKQASEEQEQMAQAQMMQAQAAQQGLKGATQPQLE